jgi:hypothetical protein
MFYHSHIECQKIIHELAKTEASGLEISRVGRAVIIQKADVKQT